MKDYNQSASGRRESIGSKCGIKKKKLYKAGTGTKKIIIIIRNKELKKREQYSRSKCDLNNNWNKCKLDN